MAQFLTGSSPNSASYWDTIHDLTGVSALHMNDLAGENVTISTFDSSFDLSHSGITNRVAGSYNFLTNSNDTPPSDSAHTSHGTKTALISLGHDDRLLSPAYKAKLGAYKVLADTSEIIPDGGYVFRDSVDFEKALSKAREHGGNIFSFTTGDGTAWSVGALSDVITDYYRKGTLIVSSASNYGLSGAFRLMNRSTPKCALSVGNYDTANMPAYEVTAVVESGAVRDRIQITYVHGNTPEGSRSLSLSLASIDLCSRLQSTANEAPILPTNTILLLKVSKPGDMECMAKLQWYIDDGAAGFLLWTDSYSQGLINNKYLGKLDKESRNVQAPNLNGRLAGVHPTSGSGPTYDMSLGVHIVAPGTELITGDISGDGYTTVSGTSFASPYIAGLAAQVLGHLGGPDALGPEWPAIVKNRIIHSGTPVLATAKRKRSGSATSIFYEPPWEQGAGVPDGFRAAYTTVDIDAGVLELNDTNYKVTDHVVTFTNSAPTPITLTLDNQIGPGVFSMKDGELLAYDEMELRDDLYAKAEFTNTTFTIPARGKHQITVSFTFPKIERAEFARLPLFGGWITVKEVKKEANKWTIPYFGCAGAMRDLLPISRADIPRLAIARTRYEGIPRFNQKIILRPYASTQRVSDTTSPGNGLYAPVVYLSMGSPLVRVDYVIPSPNVRQAQEAWTYPPQPGHNGFVGNAEGCIRHFADVTYSPSDFNTPRAPLFESEELTGRIAGGTVLGAGEYRLRVMALKITGNVNNEEDWDIWTLPYRIYVVGPEGVEFWNYFGLASWP
ncbi:subtilisin-like protein [Ascobolus immersus RN42]|uniref:Subtilisin-like protein n=1 Tax=Ascobolus immersus RN42 TaxID=1160509 RepID=A0A3N4HWC1_ASCIM|nr:subtilisin-like protein [Ascobolus immersus RN42]